MDLGQSESLDWWGTLNTMRRALIIGIDDYPEAPLTGCVSDAKRMHGVLSRNADGTLNFQCEVFTSPPTILTRAEVRKAIERLFKEQADVAFFHFSGHGVISGSDGYIVTPDAIAYDVGIPMSEILSMANSSQVDQVFLTLDCCNSGVFGTVPELKDDRAVISDGVSIITATRGNQESLEEGGGGIFTSLLVEALEGGAAGLLGDVTAASTYAYINNSLGAWDQRPMFKTNVSRFIVLRRAKPRIDLPLLKSLVRYFPLPAEELPLTPAYEPEVEPHDEEKELAFRDLQRLRHAGLVEPVGEEHMYYAAMNSKACRLTMLGRYYWRLVSQDKL